MKDRIEHAANILDAWGQAIRNDWSSIDGRSCRAQLWEISAYLRGERDTLTYADVDVCPNGHWLEWCSDYGCPQEDTA